MSNLPRVDVDVRSFSKISVIDTCSVWNLFSSAKLLAASRSSKLMFLVTDYVRYEALVRKRSAPSENDIKMQDEFKEALQAQKDFSLSSVSIEDLIAIANHPNARKLGRGEIAALALARQLRTAFLSDDQGARKMAKSLGAQPAQTTPHLLGWLYFSDKLDDSDVRTVIIEHEARVPANRGRLSRFFKAVYEEACRCKFVRDHPAAAQ